MESGSRGAGQLYHGQWGVSYLGGDFARVNLGRGEVARRGLAATTAADGVVTPYNPLNTHNEFREGGITALSIAGNHLLVGGTFSYFNPQPAEFDYNLDGQLFEPGLAAFGLSELPASATVAVLATPTNGGTVAGGGTFLVGSTHQISAAPNSGWTFIGWDPVTRKIHAR